MSEAGWVDDGVRMVDRKGSREARSPAGRSGGERSGVERRADVHDGLGEDLGVRVYGEDDWVLPGMDESGPRCGEYYPDGVCEECGRVHHGAHQCGRRGCPDCWGSWANDSAVRATERLQAYRHTQPDTVARRLVHAVVSPSEPPQTKRGFYEALKEAYGLAKEKGIEGGIVVPHGYRVEEEAKVEYERADPDVGHWVWIRREYPDSWREMVYWSPHFHIIGIGPDVEPGAPEEDDGWVFKNIRSLTRYSLRDVESYEDVYGLVRYLLSHATYNREDEKNVVRWFGSLSTASFAKDDRPSSSIMNDIEEMTEEAAEWSVEDESGGVGGSEEEDDERDVCGSEECEGAVISVFDVPQYLRRNDPGREIRERMELAREWRMGYVHPPPGLKSPRDREQFEEAFEVMLGGA